MRSRIDNNIDELIGRVKEITARAGFVFFTGYPPAKAPNPIEKYCVAVINEGVKTNAGFVGGLIGDGTRGEGAQISLRLRVYAPQRSSGEALLRASALTADAVRRADERGEVDSIELCGVKYDDYSRTPYRDILLIISGLLKEEDGDD